LWLEFLVTSSQRTAVPRIVPIIAWRVDATFPPITRGPTPALDYTTPGTARADFERLRIRTRSTGRARTPQPVVPTSQLAKRPPAPGREASFWPALHRPYLRPAGATYPRAEGVWLYIHADGTKLATPTTTSPCAERDAHISRMTIPLVSDRDLSVSFHVHGPKRALCRKLAASWEIARAAWALRPLPVTGPEATSNSSLTLPMRGNRAHL